MRFPNCDSSTNCDVNVSHIIHFNYCCAIHFYHSFSVDSLRLLVRNCTGDLDGLISVIEDFFEKEKVNQNNNSESEFERAFRHYLKDVAAHRYRHLESGLEWVLGLYKFVFPLLIIQLLMKVLGGGGEKEGGTTKNNFNNDLRERDRIKKTDNVMENEDFGAMVKERVRERERRARRKLSIDEFAKEATPRQSR